MGQGQTQVDLGQASRTDITACGRNGTLVDDRWAQKSAIRRPNLATTGEIRV